MNTITIPTMRSDPLPRKGFNRSRTWVSLA